MIRANVPNKLPMVGPKNPADVPACQRLIFQQVGLLNGYSSIQCYGHMGNIFAGLFLNNFPFYPIATGYTELVKFDK